MDRLSESTTVSKGSPDRTRTCDKVVNSHLLYQLSYRGLGWRIDHSPNAEIYWTAPTLAREE